MFEGIHQRQIEWNFNHSASIKIVETYYQAFLNEILYTLHHCADPRRAKRNLKNATEEQGKVNIAIS
jgi:hypothetical protein